MTIAYDDTRIVTPIEELILQIASAVFVTVKQITKRIPFFISYFLVLIVLVSFGTLYTLVFYFPLLAARKAIKKSIRTLLKQVDDIDTRRAMELHLQIESQRVFLERSVKKGRGFFVFLPITRELEKTASHFRMAESILFKKAYPGFGGPLHPHQGRQLTETFKDWEEDWADEEMDVYR